MRCATGMCAFNLDWQAEWRGPWCHGRCFPRFHCLKVHRHRAQQCGMKQPELETLFVHFPRPHSWFLCKLGATLHRCRSLTTLLSQRACTGGISDSRPSFFFHCHTSSRNLLERFGCVDCSTMTGKMCLWKRKICYSQKSQQFMSIVDGCCCFALWVTWGSLLKGTRYFVFFWKLISDQCVKGMWCRPIIVMWELWSPSFKVSFLMSQHCKQVGMSLGCWLQRCWPCYN